MIKRYRKKPVVIEACQLKSDNVFEIVKWCKGFIVQPGNTGVNPVVLGISTKEGTMGARQNDWIIKGVMGEFYPCKPNIFKATYEEA